MILCTLFMVYIIYLNDKTCTLMIIWFAIPITCCTLVSLLNESPKWKKVVLHGK